MMVSGTVSTQKPTGCPDGRSRDGVIFLKPRKRNSIRNDTVHKRGAVDDTVRSETFRRNTNMIHAVNAYEADKPWHVIRVRANAERQVARSLSNRDIAVFLPVQRRPGKNKNGIVIEA